MPSAFVTGATGFVGGHLVRVLEAQGWDVVCLRRTPPKDGTPSPAYVLGDITDEASLLAGMPSDYDAVFHVAADIRHWHVINEAQNRINIGGTRNVARTALARGAKRFVHCSSDAVWGLRLPMLREDVPRRGADEPVNYHRSKFWAEEEIRCALDQGLDAVMVNPTNILGPGDVHGWSMFAVSVDRGMNLRPPPGAGAFVHVDEVAKAMVRAAEVGRTGHNYLLGGVNASYLEFAQACARALGKSEPRRAAAVRATMKDARAQEARALVTGREPGISVDTARVLCATLAVDSGKAIRELGFVARPLDEIMTETVAWLREAGLVAPAV